VGLHGTLGENHENDVNTLTVDVLGTAVEIAAEPPLLAELQAAVVDLQPASGADRQLALVPDGLGLELRDDGHIVRRGVDPAIAAATVIWRLNAIAGQSTRHPVLIHGACVAGPLGGAVLLPGGTGAGKSTLTAACVAAELTYLTDELVALDQGASSVTPYAKPLSLDDGRLVPASSLGRVANRPATPRALVFPRYQPGAAVSETPLDPPWALMALIAHAIHPAGLGRTALTWLAGLALTCPARQITYGDAEQAVRTIERAADGPGRPVGAAETLPPVTDHTTTVGMADSLAVLHEPSGKVHLLNPSAAAMWCRAAAVDADDRSLLVGAALGAIDSERPERWTVAATIDQLVRSGLLQAPTGT
jgi:hypothetical protein